MSGPDDAAVGDAWVVVDDMGSPTRVSSNARVSVEVTYEDGEMIPGEGIARTKRKSRSRFATAGGAAFGAGLLVSVLGSIGLATLPPPCKPTDWCLRLIDPTGLYVGVIVIGGVAAAVGLGFLIAAVLAPASVQRVIARSGFAFTF